MNTFFSIHELKNYAFIIVGSVFLALAVVGFFAPSELITGGTAGLALLIHYITNLTIGSIIVLINLPLILLGIKFLGKMFAVRTIITIILISVFIDFLTQIIHLKPFIIDDALGAIFGGICVGIGLAFIIKGESTAGGSTILAKIISSKTELKPGQVILVIDSMIIFSSLFILEDTGKVLWSIISIYITAKVIDVMLTGNLNKKVVYLVTQKTDLFKELIRNELGPQGTIIKGDGLFDNEDKKMILIVVKVDKLQKLRELVKKNDPEGFLIITEATEMLGRGH
ncbi:YitT family protein [Arcobacter sp. F2176]|uniref:YitT family protein n=1 Tax=Arcobacter sp. F2176 TaxID=2044511 RepID=UPI00100A2653|nr:YitT family protein [Arcobacter sp. F2176]RXJ80747.1 membrane protein [Arcobacter sp. F2176]